MIMSMKKSKIDVIAYALRSLGIHRYGMYPAISEKTGYSQTLVTKVMGGHAVLTERFVSAVCAGFGINRNWLENGEVPIFVSLPEGYDVFAAIEQASMLKNFASSIIFEQDLIKVHLKSRRKERR